MILDYLDAQKPLFFKEGITYKEVFLSEPYIRFWTFIHKYGERFFYDKKLDDRIRPYKGNLGHCIHQSYSFTKALNKILDDNNIKYARMHYAEGLCSAHPFSLHAWNIRICSRHARVVDYTWNIEAYNLWYQGVIFDIDFQEEIRKRQENEGYKNTLPYLSSGSCCLTYKPLIYGEISDFSITESDTEAALVTLKEFIFNYVVKEK